MAQAVVRGGEASHPLLSRQLSEVICSNSGRAWHWVGVLFVHKGAWHSRVVLMFKHVVFHNFWQRL
jgi:hypothetical protein